MSTTAPNGSSSRIMTTPIRAITSTISNRSAPLVPPASQAYEPLLKSLFQHRLKFVLLYSALATWFINFSWAWWQLGGAEELGLLGTLALPFSPWIMFLGLLSWSTVALPIIVLRKVFLHSNRSNAASPLQIIKIALSQDRTRIAFVAYVVSSISALAIHVAISYYYGSKSGGDPKLSLFVKSKKHPHYLNGRLVFLTFAQLSAAFAFSLRGAMTDRFSYKWADFAGMRGASAPFLVGIASAVSAVYAGLAISMATVLFAVTRGLLPIVYKVPFASLLLRPFTAHFLKGQWSMLLFISQISLIVRAWFLAFSTFLIWELADSLFEKVIEEIAPVSFLSSDPNTTLISGLTSNDHIFKLYAYSELNDLAQEQTTSAAARRVAIFGDQQSPLNHWAFLVRESLLLLGNDYQLCLRRGRPAPPPVVAPPVTPKVIASPHIATPTPLLRQRVFKTSEESPGQAALDALASDGLIAKVVDAGASRTHVPELFRTVEQQFIASPIATEAKKNVQSATGYGSLVKSRIVSSTTLLWTKYAPQPLREYLKTLSNWWSRDRISRGVEASLPFRELDVVAVDALSHLVCASLSEDRYGIVQRDIPKILEAFISYLSAVEAYQIEISALEKPLPSTGLTPKEQEEHDFLAVEIQKSHAVLAVMGDGLKEGIARVVQTFGDKLLAYKFPPRIAHKLQAFLDYSQ